MGEGVAVALAAAGASDIVVTNRTEARAEQLAARVGGRVVPFGAMASALGEIDVLLTSTGSGSVLIDHDMMAAARRDVTTPLLIVDIAVPRDVSGAVAALPGVSLLDLDNLRDWAGRGIEKRLVEAESVRAIVGEEVERFTVDVTARQAAPLVAQLHEHAEAIRVAELDRFSARLSSLDPAQRAAVEAVTKGIVAKLLHTPSVRLKDDVGTPSGERNAATVRDLFDLG
jgi:glutamyl-tRNA reductase